MELKFIALSGTTDVTQNCYLYEYGDEMIMMDCGVGFPDPDMYGVDLVIPDFTYVYENERKLKAIVVTHGHEDHLGALPFLLKNVSAPIYATKLTAGFITEKLRDYGMKHPEIHVMDPEKDSVKVGSFTITPFRVSHSVPDAAGICLGTPQGNIFHVPDYKFDWMSVDKKPFDVMKAALLASDGALALASDCLGSTTPGHTSSEEAIEGIIDQIAGNATGHIFFTTISSNIARIQQAMNVAKRYNRQVCFLGQSIMRKADIARSLGYLHYNPKDLVPTKRAARMPKNKIMFIVSGSYGQPGSALYRIAMNEHDTIAIEENDTVVFSGDPSPPGSKAHVDFVVDRLIERGADVHYYDTQEDLHVSGHGSQEDILFLLGLIKPKYFIPIGGTLRHMKAYKDMAVKMGADPKEVFMLSGGETVHFQDNRAVKGAKVPSKEVLVDGLGVGDVGSMVLRDRHILAQEGVAIVLLTLDTSKEQLVAEPEIISRGFIFDKTNGSVLLDGAHALSLTLSKKRIINSGIAKRETIDFLEQWFFEAIGRRPMILPVVVEV